MVIIIVEGYGDFDMSYVDSTWINSDLDGFDVSLLPNADLHKNADKLIKALKQHGFKKVKAKSVTFGGGY